MEPMMATALMKAASASDIDLLKVLLKQKESDVNESVFVERRGMHDDRFETVLTMVFNSKWKRIKPTRPIPGLPDLFPLLDENSDHPFITTHKEEEYEFQPLSSKDIEIISLLLQNGANIHKEGRYGYSNIPLVLLCEIGDAEILKAFLKHIPPGTEVEGTSWGKALNMAACKDRCDIIDILAPFVKSLKLSEPDKLFQNCLLSAARKGHYDCLKLLIDVIKYFDYEQLLNVASNCGFHRIFTLVRNTNVRKFKRLVKTNGRSMVTLAAGFPYRDYRDVYINEVGESYAIVKDLLDCGAKVLGTQVMSKRECDELYDSDDFYNSERGYDKLGDPLIYSMSAEISELLIMHGGNVNRIGYQKFHHRYMPLVTPLQHAMLINSAEMVEILLKHGATVDNKFMMFALKQLDGPKGRSMEKIAHLIINSMSANVNPNRLMQRCDFDPRPHHDFGSDPGSLFSFAVEVNNDILLKGLIKKGADINKTYYTKSYTPLMIAALNDDIFQSEGQRCELIKLLIDNGAQLDDVNINGFTALMLARKSEVMCTLLAAGANADYIFRGSSFMSRLVSSMHISDSLKMIKHIVNDRSGQYISLKENMRIFPIIQECIQSSESSLQEFINAGFSPHVTEDIKLGNYRLFNEMAEYVKDILSPLCTALFFGYVQIAEDFLNQLYVTPSDLTVLPYHEHMRKRFSYRNMHESLKFLDKMASTPASLMQLTFARVSHSIGSQPGREDRIRLLKLPSTLEDHLLFKHLNIRRNGDDGKDKLEKVTVDLKRQPDCTDFVQRDSLFNNLFHAYCVDDRFIIEPRNIDEVKNTLANGCSLS